MDIVRCFIGIDRLEIHQMTHDMGRPPQILDRFLLLGEGLRRVFDGRHYPQQVFAQYQLDIRL